MNVHRRFVPSQLRATYKSWAVQIADMQGQTLPPDLKTGSPLKLTGTVTGSTLRVAKFSDMQRARIARASMNQVLTGSVKLLVVVLKFPGLATPVRMSRIRTNVLGAVGANFKTCSYGQLLLDQASTVVGPIDVTAPPAGSPPCSADVQGLEDSWITQANAALKARQINPTAWSYILYVLPTDPAVCLVKGWANLRCNGQATSGSDDPACYGAIYSTGANDQAIFLREVRYGCSCNILLPFEHYTILHHATTHTQLGYMLGSTDAGTASSANGDRTTPMGNGTATCYNTPNLHKLGWIAPQVFCDGGQGDNSYNNYNNYNNYNDYGQSPGLQAQAKKVQASKHPKLGHHSGDDNSEDNGNSNSNNNGNNNNNSNNNGNSNSNNNDYSSPSDPNACTPLAVGDVQQVSIAMTTYGGDIQNPPQAGQVGIRLEPWDPKQIPLYLGYISAKGSQGVVMNGLPMGLRRKTAFYTYGNILW